MWSEPARLASADLKPPPPPAAAERQATEELLRRVDEAIATLRREAEGLANARIQYQKRIKA